MFLKNVRFDDVKIKKLSNILFIAISFLLFIYMLYNYNSFFYQQDEYYYFWLYSRINVTDIFFTTGELHYYPLNNFIQFIIYKTFDIFLLPRVIISTTVHLLYMGIIYYYISKKFSKSITFGTLLLISILGVNSLSSQAFTWMSTYVGTIGSSIFGFFSYIFFIKYIDVKKTDKLLYSLILVLISLLFKEYYVFLFLSYLIYVFFDLLHKPTKLKTLHILVVFIFSLIYLNLRFLTDASMPDIDIYTITTRVFNYLLFIFLAPTKLLFPIITNITNKIAFNSTNAFDLFLIIISITSNFVIYILFIYKTLINKNKSMLFILLSLGMFFTVFSFTTPKFDLANIENRYYYVLGLPIMFLLINFYDFSKKYTKLILLLIVLLSLTVNVILFISNNQKLKASSYERMDITTQILSQIKNSNKKGIIIYANGSKSYYGLEDLRYPFQSGLGNIIAIHLYSEDNFITENYFKNPNSEIFYNINSNIIFPKSSQGEIHFENKVFGFYYNTEICKNIKKYINKNYDLYYFYIHGGIAENLGENRLIEICE